MGVLQPSGRWLNSYDEFKSALEKNNSMLAELGEISETSPLRNPAEGDFRLKAKSKASEKGAKVFVPWALSGVVGEWNFYHTGDDPSHIIDEHWYMTDYHVSRDTYYQRPMYPLKGVNITQDDYIRGPLEDWIPGALNFSAAKGHYAILSNAEMMKPFSFRASKKSAHEGARPENWTVEGEALKNPQIYKSNFLIEIYFKTTPGHTGGVLMEKMHDSGYGVTINQTGGISFTVKGTGVDRTVRSKSRVNDGAWHHAIVEADRKAVMLTVYLDGRKDASDRGVDSSVFLANDGDLHVGGTPEGRYFDGTLDFLRIAQGTLSDADTTIEELYAWEFKGPFLTDFTGREPAGARRDAGAIEGE